MYDGIKLFLEWVGYFFIAYLIGYSTFLFLSVVVGSLELYKHRRQEMLKSILPRVGQNGVPMGMTLFFPASSSKHFSSYFKSFCIRVASFLETQIDETPIPFFAVFS